MRTLLVLELHPEIHVRFNVCPDFNHLLLLCALVVRGVLKHVHPVRVEPNPRLNTRAHHVVPSIMASLVCSNVPRVILPATHYTVGTESL